MTEVSLGQGLLLATLLFVLGFLGLCIRRNLFLALLSVEIMLNAAALAFVVASGRQGSPDGQIFFVLILTIAAAETAVGLALLLNLWRQARTVDVDSLDGLKG